LAGRPAGGDTFYSAKKCPKGRFTGVVCFAAVCGEFVHCLFGGDLKACSLRLPRSAALCGAVVLLCCTMFTFVRRGRPLVDPLPRPPRRLRREWLLTIPLPRPQNRRDKCPARFHKCRTHMAPPPRHCGRRAAISSPSRRGVFARQGRSLPPKKDKKPL